MRKVNPKKKIEEKVREGREYWWQQDFNFSPEGRTRERKEVVGGGVKMD